MTTLTSTMIVRLLDRVTGPAKGVSSALTGIGRAASGVNGSLSDRLGAAIERNNAALDRARGGMVDAVAGIYALGAAYKGTVGSAVEFESAMADLGKVSGFDDAGLADFGKKLRTIATGEIPMAVDQLAALAEQAASAGVADKDLLEFTRLTAKAAVAWGITGEAAGENLAKLRSAMGLSNAETASFADAINHVADNMAASAPDMLNFARRATVTGDMFGFTKEQTLAFGGAMISAGAEADVAGTSFFNMGRALTKGASATERQEAAFGKLGLNARKVAKAMQKDAVGTTLKVIDNLNKLPEHVQASVMSDLFGDEARALTPLIGNTDMLREALALTAQEQSYANSVGKEFEKRAKTSAYRIQRFKSQVNDLGLAIGGALLPGLNDTLETLGPLALKLSEIAEANPKLVKAVVMSTAGLMGLRVGLTAVRYGALLARGGLLSLASPIVAVGSWATKAAGQSIALQRALGAMGGQKLTGLQTAAAGMRGIAMAVPGIGMLGSIATGVGTFVAAITAPAWGAIALGVAAVAAAGYAVWKYWDRITAVVSGVARAIGEQLQPVIETVQPVLDRLAPIGDAIAAGWDRAKAAISGFGEWVGSFFSREVLTEEQKGQWETAGYDVATHMIEAVKTKIGELVDWFTGLPGRILSAIGTIDITSRFKIPSFSDLNPFGGGGDAASAANDNAAKAIDGARAAGGPVRRGGLYLVGEEGPELFNPKTSGSIMPSAETMSLMRGAASGGSAIGGSRSSGERGGAATVTVHAPMNVTVNGVQDPMQLVDVIGRELGQRLAFELRGAHSDGRY